MSVERFPVTPKGYEQMQEELKQLKTVERPAVIMAIAEAREHGDLSENAEYSAAREKQGFIESKILDLESKISRVEVIHSKDFDKSKIKFGATVRLIDQDTNAEVEFTLVGDYEADLRLGLISVSSPIAKSLLAKSVGDNVEVTTPKGTRYYDVLSITY
jgi:transcription elongation factor GreA